MMDHDSEEDSAINLSTNQITRNIHVTANGNVDSDDSENSTKVQGGKSSDRGDSLQTGPPPLLMITPQVLAQQQMQQILQQQLLSPAQIQQILQQQQTLFVQQQKQQQQQLKQLESVIPHLQEQLQLNMIQQTQLLQQLTSLPINVGAEKGMRQQLQAQLQQLALQQHQLIQQLQLSHRQYVVGMQSINTTQGENSSSWKESDENGNPPGVNGLHHGSSPSSAGQSSQQQNGIQSDAFVASPSLTPPTSHRTGTPKDERAGEPPNHLLYGHGVCKWPGCEMVCDDYQAFITHLNVGHQLDDRSTAQARVQMQVVAQLEMQLKKEKDRLQAMMEHLHMKPSSSSGNCSPRPDIANPENKSGSFRFHPSSASKALPPSPPLSMLPSSSALLSSASPLMATIPPRLLPSSLSQPMLPPAPNSTGHLRRRLSDKGYSPVSGLDSSSYPEPPVRRRATDRINLDITEEITRNRDFYKSADVRPPFTYASLIRQAIIESPERQLTLNEIYNWFQNTFCYFRRNAATWKNAVRHNLSLHKCFMRVENVKGAVWTVDELEFYRRRPQRLQERIGTLSLSSQQESQGSSPLSQNPSLFGDSLSSSIQAALTDASLPNFLHSPALNNHHHQQSAPSSNSVSTSAPSAPISCALSEAEKFVANLMCHNLGLGSSNQTGNDIQVKQEPEMEETDDINDDYLVEEPDEQSGMTDNIEEAEDLSQQTSISQTSSCL